MLDDLGGRYFDELRPFVESGRIRLAPVGGKQTDEGDLGLMVTALQRAAIDPHRHLLTDEHTAHFVQAMIDSGEITVPSRASSNAREARIHHGLVELVPSLPLVPLGVIDDIRDELDAPLGRYRHDVASLARTFGSSAYSPEIAADIEHAWVTTVSPAIRDVEEALSISRRLGAFAESLGLTGTPPAILGLISHQFLGWMPTDEVVMTGIGAGAATAVAKTAHDEIKSRRAAKTMGFYFLHKADSLARRHL